MMGSLTFIMVAFMWRENSTPASFASAICASRKRVSACLLMKVPSRISPASRGVDSFRTGTGAIGGDEFDLGVGGFGNGDGFFVGEEIAESRHGADVGLGVFAPCAHGMRVLLRVVFDCFRGATVGISFA